MVSGGMTCVKYLLFVFNLLFAISGIAILTIGAIIQTWFLHYGLFVYKQYFMVAPVLITVGVIVFIVAFFGCCGAVKENNCMIITFSVFLLAIFTLELGGGIAGYMLRDNVKEMLDETLNSTMPDYGQKTEVTKGWDIMQYDFSCCGVYNYTDWKYAFGNDTLPVTCCPKVIQGEKCEVEVVYREGCLTKLATAIEHNAVILGGTGIGIALVQLFGVVLACCLARSIRQDYETV